MTADASGRRRASITSVAATPGAAAGVVGGLALVAATWDWLGVRQRPWIGLAILVVAAAVGWAQERVVGRGHRGEATGAAALATLAAAACVPETSHLPEIGALLALFALADAVLPQVRHVVVPTGSALAAWASLYGTVGRPSAVIGVLVAFAPLVGLGAVAGRVWWARLSVGGACFVAAAAMARTGGISTTGGLAEPLAWAALWVSVMIVAVVLAAVWLPKLSAARSACDPAP